MGQQTLSKSAFSRLARCSPSAITQALEGPLNPALVGRRIDVGHPAALEYLQKRMQPTPLQPATGIDALYEQAVQLSRQHGSLSVNHLKKALKIGHDRAAKLAALIRAADGAKGQEQPVLITAPPVVAIPTSEEGPPTSALGQAVTKEAKKRAVSSEHQDPTVPDNISHLADLTIREVIMRFGTDDRFVDYVNAVQKIEKAHETRLKNLRFEGKLITRDLVKAHIIDPFNAVHVNLLTDGSRTIARECKTMSDANEDITEIELYVERAIMRFIRPVKSKVEKGLRSLS